MAEFNFKPFDKVLVRDHKEHRWAISFFSNVSKEPRDSHPFVTINRCIWTYCIPYEGNEKLLDTTDPYVEHYAPKYGDFVAIEETHPNGDKAKWICILDVIGIEEIHFLVGLDSKSYLLRGGGKGYYSRDRKESFRPATEEEKQLLLSRLAELGKKWNPEKKCIEDVWTPKDGDFIIPVDYTESEKLRGLHIYRRKVDNSTDHLGYVGIDFLGHLTFDMFEPWSGTYRLATDSEKQQLLDALHKKGKDWDAEKKEIVEYRWIPKDGEEFYMVSETGKIASLTNKESWFINDLIEIGNCFRTKAEAQAMADKVKALLKGGKE